MKVTIKDFAISMEVKNRGVEFEVKSADGKDHLGDLVLTKRHLIWCPGRSGRNGPKSREVTWKEFIEYMKD